MKQFYAAVGGIVEKNGSILILRRSSDKDFAAGSWEVITGRLEAEENPSRGIIREIEEETTLRAEVILPVNTGFFYRGNRDYPMIIIDFWCKYLEGTVELSWEHSEYRWVSLQDAAVDLNLKPFQRGIQRILSLKNALPTDFDFSIFR